MMIQTKAKALYVNLKELILLRWIQLNTRDQRIVLIAIGSVAILLVYLILFLPIFKWETKSREQAIVEYEDFVYMSEHIEQAKKQSQLSQQSSKMPDKTIASTAQALHINISRLQPSLKKISVWINEVEYNHLIKWLLMLDNQYKITVNQLKIEATKIPGMVKVFVILNS
ncbi:MAG: type II secretion system protein M [Endozoicomonadaceae bacterium]|nr:type II secretion system protein M [Endozoicomonadaceae bacterium]